MSFWHSIFKTSDTSAVDVLYLQRWNFYTSTSNVNLCCIGHLGKHGKRGKKRKNCIFMIFEERRRCRCTIHCSTMNAYVSCVSNTPFFFENGVWEDVFLSMCFTWLTCILLFSNFLTYWNLFWLKTKQKWTSASIKKLLPKLRFQKKRECWIRKMHKHLLYYSVLYINIVVFLQKS